MKCTICRHASSQEVNVSLLRDGIRATARKFGLARSSLLRHKQHLPKTLTQAEQAREITAATSVLDRVEALIENCGKIAAKAQAAEQWPAALAALRETRSCLELLARLTGELRSGAGNSPSAGIAVTGDANVQVNNLAPAQNSKDLVRLMRQIYHLDDPRPLKPDPPIV